MTDPFGTHAPNPATKMLLWLTRNTILGRGKARKIAMRRLRQQTDSQLDTEIFGLRARLHTHGNHPEAKALVKPSHFAPPEFAFCRKTMPRQEGVFVDVGANAGIFSMYLCSLMQSGKLIAVEPLPLLFDRMQTNLITLNPENEKRLQINLFNVALGKENGSLELFVKPNELGQSSAHNMEKASGVTVPVRPLKDVLEEAGATSVDLLKIDVEGFEDSVLLPFFDTAPEHLWPKAIILEHCHSGRWSIDMLEHCKSIGYRVDSSDRTNAMLILESS